MLFVDEPEVNLHPKAIVLFAEMLHEFAQSGIQVYLTTHSYFLLKRLEATGPREGDRLRAARPAQATPDGGVTGTVTRLAQGLPMNPIVEESRGCSTATCCLTWGPERVATTKNPGCV